MIRLHIRVPESQMIWNLWWKMLLIGTLYTGIVVFLFLGHPVGHPHAPLVAGWLRYGSVALASMVWMHVIDTALYLHQQDRIYDQLRTSLKELPKMVGLYTTVPSPTAPPTANEEAPHV